MCETCEQLKKVGDPNGEEGQKLIQAHRMDNDACMNICLLRTIESMTTARKFVKAIT